MLLLNVLSASLSEVLQDKFHHGTTPWSRAWRSLRRHTTQSASSPPRSTSDRRPGAARAPQRLFSEVNSSNFQRQKQPAELLDVADGLLR
eukprot:7057483-Prymnesium_polylepis.1